MTNRIACFGGVYNNYLALQAAVGDAQRRGIDSIYCLGDMGAFGPHPDRVFPILHENDVLCIQGNYDDSIGNALDDCQCGYTDPRDNRFAQISYDYTLANTSEKNRAFLRSLPKTRRLELGSQRVLLCHGSPRKVNEFLWESTTSTHFLEAMLRDHDADVIAATHTGIKWHRTLPANGHLANGHLANGHLANGNFINAGVLGRPENDGRTNVWYTVLEASSTGDLHVEFIPIEYDHVRLAREMREEALPKEFVETVLTGWWTTCLEMLPAKERRRGVA